MCSAIRFRHPLRRFTNDLKIADHSILKHGIGEKLLLATASVALDFLCALQNMG
jgi:hypothetical protein